MSIDLSVHKIRKFILLHDNVAAKISSRAAKAYFRAFVLESRETGKISLKYRFSYKDPDEKSWYEIGPKGNQTAEEAITGLTDSIVCIMKLSAERVGVDASSAIEVFDVPDDEGDWGRTVIWLEMHDLVDVSIEEKA